MNRSITHALAIVLVIGAPLGAQVSIQGAARPATSGSPPASATDLRSSIGRTAVVLRPVSLPATPEPASGATIARVDLASPLGATPAGAYDLVLSEKNGLWMAHLSQRGRRVAPLHYFAVNLHPEGGSQHGLQLCPAGCRPAMHDQSGISFTGTTTASKQYDTLTVTAHVFSRVGKEVSNGAVQFAVTDMDGNPSGMVSVISSSSGTIRLRLFSPWQFASTAIALLHATAGNLQASIAINSHTEGSDPASNCSYALGWGSEFCWW